MGKILAVNPLETARVQRHSARLRIKLFALLTTREKLFALALLFHQIVSYKKIKLAFLVGETIAILVPLKMSTLARILVV